MGEYKSKNKVNQNRTPDTRNYAGKHEAKSGCLFMVMVCLGIIVFWCW